MIRNLIVISAPSGAGKSTICRELQNEIPSIRFSVSCTTRPKRRYEKNGYDYYFISEEDFNEKVKNKEMVEYEEVHGYLYGTLRSAIDEAIKNRIMLLLEVDVKGGLAIKKAYPDSTITVFIKPPSEDELRKRLKKRGADSEARIVKRLERVKFEMEFEKDYDYSFVNENVKKTVSEIISILPLHSDNPKAILQR